MVQRSTVPFVRSSRRGKPSVDVCQALGSIRQLSIQWVDPVREIIEFTRPSEPSPVRGPSVKRRPWRRKGRLASWRGFGRKAREGEEVGGFFNSSARSHWSGRGQPPSHLQNDVDLWILFYPSQAFSEVLQGSQSMSGGIIHQESTL